MKAEQINSVSGQIVDAALRIHKELGPGLLERVYEVILAHELRKRGFQVDRQLSVPIVFEGLHFDEGIRIDLLVERTIIVGLKAKEKILPIDKKLLLTYLRLMNKPLGLLINFNEELLKNGIHRIANNMPE